MRPFTESGFGMSPEIDRLVERPDLKELSRFLDVISRVVKSTNSAEFSKRLEIARNEIESIGEYADSDWHKSQIFKVCQLIRKSDLLIEINSGFSGRDTDFAEVSGGVRSKTVAYARNKLNELEEARDWVVSRGLVEVWRDADSKLVSAARSVVYTNDVAGEENFGEGGGVSKEMKNLRLSVDEALEWTYPENARELFDEVDERKPMNVRDKEVVLLRNKLNKQEGAIQTLPKELIPFAQILLDEYRDELAELDDFYFSETGQKYSEKITQLRNSLYCIDRDLASFIRLGRQLGQFEMNTRQSTSKINRRQFLTMAGGVAVSLVSGIVVDRYRKLSKLPEVDPPNPPTLELKPVPMELVNLGVPTPDKPETTDNEFERDSEAMLLARTLFGESRGRSEKLKVAVGFTVLNRMKQRRQSLHDVVLDPSQYSCFLKSDPNFSVLKNPLNKKLSAGDRAEWPKCYKIAEALLAGKLKDPTGGAVYFHTEAVSGKYEWMTTKQRVCKIENTIFYKE